MVYRPRTTKEAKAMKQDLIDQIVALLQECKDIVLLDFIFKLLVESRQ